MGFNGSTSSAPVVMLDLLFLKRAFRGRYLVIEEGHGVMGRDILNYLALLLDGAFVDWLKSSSLMEDSTRFCCRASPSRAPAGKEKPTACSWTNRPGSR